MTAPASPIRCPACGSDMPVGVGVPLCPVCILTDETDEDPDPDAGSASVGTYQILEEVARGGMGVVYRARQRGLNRIVALKVLPGAAFASASFRARFQREAEAAARLRHPGIVAVHEVGLALGQPFLSMDFVEGPSLSAKLSTSAMAPVSAARILMRVAEAVAYAHRMGVAHRDLKPSNILLAEEERPVLTDFGLACFTDLDAQGGNTLDLMGSPPYLPPERVAAGGAGDPVREDVYGLGAVLYHCLTGRPPFVADSVAATLAAVTADDPLPPRRLNASVPVDLETICLKCLEKSPSARYARAGDVAEELGRFLRGEPILARPPVPLDRLMKLVRRRPLVASLVLALMATVAGGTAASLIGWRHAAKNAADSRAIAEKRRIDLYSADLAAATAAMEAGNRTQARELLERCRPPAGESDLRGCEWFVADELLRSRGRFSVKAHGHILAALAWSADGSRLYSGAYDGSLKGWVLSDDGSLTPGRTLLDPAQAPLHQVMCIGGGHILTAEGAFIRCRMQDGGPALWEIPGVRFSLAWESGILAVTTGAAFFFEPPGRISLYQIGTDLSVSPKHLRELPFPARAVAISPDGGKLAAGLPKDGHHDEESGLKLLDLTRPQKEPLILETHGAIQSLAFSPDSSRLVATTQSTDPRVLLFDAVAGAPLHLASPHEARVWFAGFTPDSQTLLTTSSDRSIVELPLQGAHPLRLPMAHDNEIWSAALHPAGTWIATGDKDGVLKIHSLPLPAAPLDSFPRHPHFRYARPVFSPDSTVLHVCETSPQWRTVAWKPGAADVSPTPFLFYPECIGTTGTAIYRDTETRRILRIDPSGAVETQNVPAASWPETPSMRNHGASEDGRFAYQFSESGTAAVIGVSDGSVRTTEDFSRERPTASAISPDGRFLIAATWSELIVHDFASGRTTRLSNDPHWAKTLAFSPDGKLLASGGNDGHILLRAVPDFRVIRKFSGHRSEVSGLGFSPDGRTLVSSELGCGLRFWRLDAAREVLRVALPDVCESLVFSPDGRQLAVTTCPPASPPEAGQVLVIPCAPEDER